MTVTVTADHIQRGTRCNSLLCMVALAVMAVFPDATAVEVQSQIAVRFRGGALADRHFILSPKAALAIRAFDLGERVEPFSFELVELPPFAHWQSRWEEQSRAAKRKP